jgi:methylated-DNA-[protein]-cysteine S-methyltransferase
MKSYWFYDSPIGRIIIAEADGCIANLYFVLQNRKSKRVEQIVHEFEEKESPLIRLAVKQLKEYFGGKRRDFELPLSFAGTEFQQRVWAALLTIPYGETRSYGEIAKQIGNPKAARAVGMANNRNPISIICPCHRVVGKGGSLVGYASGLGNKEYLLNLEAGKKT